MDNSIIPSRVQDISAVLRPFWKNTRRVLQLPGVDNYLLRSANAS
jgi:hypothetical protein